MRTVLPDAKWKADPDAVNLQVEAQDQVRQVVIAAMAWQKAFVEDTRRREQSLNQSETWYLRGLALAAAEGDLLKACEEMMA